MILLPYHNYIRDLIFGIFSGRIVPVSKEKGSVLPSPG